MRGLSFSVRSGEVVGFLGPNGAGKSSTLKALMGFLNPQSGTCRVFGEPAGSVQAKRRIGYLPEVALYYPYLTPLETLRLYGELQGLGGKALRRESETLLERVGLQSAMTRQNRMLSKGMLQRVGIAQALLGSPDLLILDEVTSGLDPVGRRELRELLSEKRREGATLFFSSHELAEVDLLCDRILLIDRGQLVEEREVPKLKADLRRFALVYAGPAMPGGRPLGEERYELVYESKDAMLRGLGEIAGAGGRVEDLLLEEASLEDYFIQTLGRAA